MCKRDDTGIRFDDFGSLVHRMWRMQSAEGKVYGRIIAIPRAEFDLLSEFEKETLLKALTPIINRKSVDESVVHDFTGAVDA